MPLTRLENSLAKRIPPVILVVGDAGLLVDRAVKLVEATVLPQCGIPAFNHAAFRFSEPGVSNALSVARTLPMMADLRLVVVRDLQAADATVLEAFWEYASAPVEGTVLVLAGEKFPAGKKGQKNWGTRIRNAVKKVGYVVPLSNRDVSAVAFVQQQVASAAKEISRRDAELLVELVGEDLARLSLEVDKLALFVGADRVIGSQAIHQASSLLAEAVIWDLTTALANRNANAAIASLHRLLEAGDAPHRLLAMVVWQFRTVLQAIEMLRAGVSEDTVRRQTRLRWETLNVVKGLVRADADASAAVVLRDLAEANRQMNRHRAGSRRVLESLVLELCRGS
jgi:DNA polymerase III subunit delta